MVSDRFKGPVHDHASADVGDNDEGERVVRVELHYTRGVTPVTAVALLSIDAACALRNLIDGFLLAGSCDPQAEIVHTSMECPECGNRVAHELVRLKNGGISCQRCGHRYRP